MLVMEYLPVENNHEYKLLRMLTSAGTLSMYHWYRFTAMRYNQNIDVARLVGFSAVVAIHANSLGLFSQNGKMFGWVIDEMGRFAVPVFFLISGYFWRPQTTIIKEYFFKASKKILSPFVFWCSIYIILDYTEILYPSLVGSDWKRYLTAPWTGSVAFHLWFLPALLIGTIIGLGLIRYMGIYKAVVVTVTLYIFGAMFGTYARLFDIVVPLGVYRNGVFFAPVFLVGGFALAQMKKPPEHWKIISCILGGFFLHALEGYLIQGFYPHGHDMSLGILPFSFGIFIAILNIRSISSKVSKYGEYVFGAYILHVLFLRIIKEFFLEEDGVIFSLFVILLVITLSIAFSQIAKTCKFSKFILP